MAFEMQEKDGYIPTIEKDKEDKTDKKIKKKDDESKK